MFFICQTTENHTDIVQQEFRHSEENNLSKDWNKKRRSKPEKCQRGFTSVGMQTWTGDGSKVH